jgi:glycosyltransferase involved in cell wall biosynthesis
MFITESISVCMATCNGGRFIAKQINSILQQLHREDELIICDDCSNDDTMHIIKSYSGPHLKIIENSSRLGVVKNFEKCIGHAKNEIIFLADQDDVWLPHKVEKTLDIFKTNPRITLVLSNAQVIDKSDNIVKKSLFKFYCPTTYGISRMFKNIFKNNYLGAAIAFRKNMTQYIIPIPSDVPMHDMWIGIINDMYGKTYYYNKALIRYRRHSTNVTSGRHASLSQMVKWRYKLIKSLIRLSINQMSKN